MPSTIIDPEPEPRPWVAELTGRLGWSLWALALVAVLSVGLAIGAAAVVLRSGGQAADDLPAGLAPASPLAVAAADEPASNPTPVPGSPSTLLIAGITATSPTTSTTTSSSASTTTGSSSSTGAGASSTVSSSPATTFPVSVTTAPTSTPAPTVPPPSESTSVVPSTRPATSTTSTTSSTRPPATEPSTTTTDAPTSTSPGPSGDDAIQQRAILDLTNAERARAGCPALVLNGALNNAADGHSEDMAARNYFSHTDPEGRGPGHRIAAAGYQPRISGENIAYGYGSAEAVVEGWMNSEGHRDNILECRFHELGVGYATDPASGNRPYWTQVFGTQR